MRIERIQLRDFRNYEAAEVELAAGLTVVAGANGAGKTNLLEAVYFGCTARSPRTSNERELVRRGGDGVARVVLDLAGDDGEHRIEVGFQPGEPKHLRVDDSPVDSLAPVEARPRVSVFLPERLEPAQSRPVAVDPALGRRSPRARADRFSQRPSPLPRGLARSAAM